MTDAKTDAEQIGDAMTAMAKHFDDDLLALSEENLSAQWYWRWEATRSAEWNIYTFSAALESHKRRCRRWESHHHGSSCVVERVRDKYLMPRIREFQAAMMAAANACEKPTT